MLQFSSLPSCRNWYTDTTQNRAECIHVSSSLTEGTTLLKKWFDKLFKPFFVIKLEVSTNSIYIDIYIIFFLYIFPSFQDSTRNVKRKKEIEF